MALDDLYITFAGVVVRATLRAVLFRFPDDTMTLPGIEPRGAVERWIPRSVCEAGDDLDVGDTDIRIAEWFCEKEGIA
jgi:hypothetical protein